MPDSNEQNYTARLENWIAHPQPAYNAVVLSGDIYEDKRNRWDEGSRIITSALRGTDAESSKGLRSGMIVETMNSRYLLGKESAYNGDVY